MAIAFYNPISESFHESICFAFNFDEKVDCCVENINELIHVMEKTHDIRDSQLSRRQVRLFLGNLQRHLDVERKISCLLKNIFLNSVMHILLVLKIAFLSQKKPFDYFKERKRK